MSENGNLCLHVSFCSSQCKCGQTVNQFLTFKSLTLIPLCSHASSERKLVPSVSDPGVPSHSTEVQPPPRSSFPSILSHTLPHSTVPKWVSVTPLLLRNTAEHFQELLLDLV